ncbi:cancer/testis antigen 1-like [Heterocephalus glaber]|uniref:Cancer/testis antigen 1-like n=1 Tax=Heterocephalus glaber TaxID=10181 RepID=A0AAX6QXL5_HETGA|nr:cancer/testis antigen 1-like [Heterocephalus glaber]
MTGSFLHRARIPECVAGVAAGKVGAGRTRLRPGPGSPGAPPEPHPPSRAPRGDPGPGRALCTAEGGGATRGAVGGAVAGSGRAAGGGGTRLVPRQLSPHRASTARASGLPTPSTPRSQPPSLLVGMLIGRELSLEMSPCTCLSMLGKLGGNPSCGIKPKFKTHPNIHVPLPSLS